MTVVEIARPPEAADWNARVEAWSGGTLFQTTFWASYYAAYLEAVPHFLTARRDGAVVGQLLVLESLRGRESVFRSRRGALVRAMSPLLRSLWWRQGPVLRDPGDTTALEALLDGVQELAERIRATGIDEAYAPIQARPAAAAAAFARREYAAERRATILIDVGRPMESLWSELASDGTRTPVRKMERAGAVFRRADGAGDLRAYYALVHAWRKSQGFPPYPPQKFSYMAQHLGAHAEMFLVEHEGRPVGGAGAWIFNRTAHLFTPVQSTDARRRRLYVGDFLYWNLIRWCHEQGLAAFDLSGVSVGQASKKEAGIRAFKEKWGGRLVAYPSFTRTRSPIRWGVTSFLQRVRRSARAVGVTG